MLNHKEQIEIVGCIERYLKAREGLSKAVMPDDKDYWREIYLAQVNHLKREFPKWEVKVRKK